MGGSLTREDLERVIDAKEGKYPAYRRRCDQAWLLINGDLASMSTWFKYDEFVLPEGAFETRFDRVFVVRHFGGAKLIEIPTTPM